MKKTITTLTCLAVMVCSTAAFAERGEACRDEGRPGDRGKQHGPAMMARLLTQHEDLATKVGITGEQIQQVKDILYEAEKQSIQLRANRDTARLELQQLMDADSPDEAAVMQAIDAVGAAEIEMHKARAKTGLGVKAVVGADKIKALRKAAREQYAKRKGKGSQGKDGRGRGEGRGKGPRGSGTKDGVGQGGPPWMQDTMPPPEDVDAGAVE